MTLKKYIDLKIGILGGGQLARMLAMNAQQMGLNVYILSKSHFDPAAQVTSHWIQGDPNSPKDIKNFLSQVDLATFESEFLEAQLLSRMSRETKTPIYPKPKIMDQLQDRWTQKKLLDQFSLTTSEYQKVDNYEEAQSSFQNFPQGMVLKKRRFGYDGFGTVIIKTQKDLTRHRNDIQNCKQGWIAEAFIPFQKELAILAARNKSGDIIFFPLVETFQQDSRCLWVKGPIKNINFNSFKKKARIFLDRIDYQGVIAFELFLYQGQWLINELAPRVHNSGHYSMDALTQNQFQVHIRAILNMPLKTPQLLQPGFAMYNLIGSSPKTPRWTLSPTYQLHWYGKLENRKGRKMGHINATHQTPMRALKILTQGRKDFQL